MRLKIISFDGNAINDGTNFQAWFPVGTVMLQADGKPSFVQRAYAPPVLAYKDPQPLILPIQIAMLGNTATQIDTLKKYFNTFDFSTTRKLLVEDRSAGSKRWYVYATPVSMPDIEKAVVTFNLAVADAAWYADVQSTDSWSITATGQTRNITIGGNMPARPVIEVTPTSAKTGGFSWKRFIKIYNTTALAFPNYPIDVTGGGLDTAALITGSKMLATGDDFRLYVDGVEVNRWLGTGANAINTTVTKLWSVISFSPKQELTLNTAIASSGGISGITFKDTVANRTALGKLPATGIILIDSELFTWTAKDLKGLQVTGITRSAKGTSLAAHSTGATCRWIEHDIWAYYGNSALPAPETVDTTKPMFRLDSSNTSWDYDDFADLAFRRAGAWRPSILRTAGKESVIYTDTHAADVDPATLAGMRLLAYQKGTTWLAETATLVWSLYQPAGVTTVSSNGEKYRGSASWPALAALQKSANAVTWANVWNQATPASLITWTSWTQASASLSGTFNNLRFIFSGAIAAAANNEADFDVQDVTLTLDSAKTPSVTLLGEQANYQLGAGGGKLSPARLTNVTTGEYININFTMATNQTLQIDCEARTVKYLLDNSLVPGVIELSTNRNDWLNLLGGQVNQLLFDDAGTAAVTLATKWYDRNN